MSIRAIINALLGSLAVVAILAVTFIAVDSMHQWQSAERAALQGRLSEQLLSAAGHWAAERGLTAGALGASSRRRRTSARPSTSAAGPAMPP